MYKNAVSVNINLIAQYTLKESTWHSMSNRLKKHWPLVQYIIGPLTPKQIKAVLSNLTSQQINAIGEIAANVLYGNINITESFKRKLRPYKTKIEYIGDSANSVNRRGHLIVQQYRMTVLLLTAVKPILKSFLQ